MYKFSKDGFIIAMPITRRNFVTGASGLAFLGLIKNFSNAAQAEIVDAYGPLQKDPGGILDLPKGFSYKIISQLGDQMDDGYPVPDRADGMGCIPLDGSKVALIRNHEIGMRSRDRKLSTLQKPLADLAYDVTENGEPLPGGTTTIIYDTTTNKRLEEYQSLIGTLTNCAGGVTPWGSWLSCEEDVTKVGKDVSLDHGWIFEVPADKKSMTKPTPLKDMGRFNHEAAAVDPETGIVYLTEDRPNSLFYRFLPNVYGELHKGGKLQALAFVDENKGRDSRNWQEPQMTVGRWYNVRWIDLTETDSPKDDLRVRGHNDGAVVFARGEGIHWGDGELYFCCTSGGRANLGQIMRYQPSPNEGSSDEMQKTGRLQLFFEAEDAKEYNYGDNLVVAPNGHLLVCEDQYTKIVDNHIRGITPDGKTYAFARLVLQTETAGACFSPEGSTLFVNVYRPTKTLAITGPWDQFKS